MRTAAPPRHPEQNSTLGLPGGRAACGRKPSRAGCGAGAGAVASRHVSLSELVETRGETCARWCTQHTHEGSLELGPQVCQNCQ